MKPTLAIAVPLLTLLAIGGAVSLASRRSLTPFAQAKLMIYQKQLVHQHATGGKAWTTPLAGPKWAPPVPSPTLTTQPTLPNGTYNITYALSNEAFSDGVNWEVVAGALAAKPSTGVVITFDIRHNLAPVILTLPGAGQVTITGFTGSQTVLIRSSTFGSGSFNIAAGKVIWSQK